MRESGNTLSCAYCGQPCEHAVSAVNRAKRAGYRLYCGRLCAGMARRVGKSAEERRREKAQYDAERRTKLATRLKREKHEYFVRTYDPEKARIQRKARAFDHVAYCRRYYADPVKKAEKVAYDIQRRGGKQYAEFMDAWRLLIELEREIRKMVPDKYERMKARGYFDKINERKRHDRQERRTA